LTGSEVLRDRGRKKYTLKGVLYFAVFPSPWQSQLRLLDRHSKGRFLA